MLLAFSPRTFRRREINENRTVKKVLRPFRAGGNWKAMLTCEVFYYLSNSCSFFVYEVASYTKNKLDCGNQAFSMRATVFIFLIYLY